VPPPSVTAVIARKIENVAGFCSTLLPCCQFCWILRCFQWNTSEGKRIRMRCPRVDQKENGRFGLRSIGGVLNANYSFRGPCKYCHRYSTAPGRELWLERPPRCSFSWQSAEESIPPKTARNHLLRFKLLLFNVVTDVTDFQTIYPNTLIMASFSLAAPSCRAVVRTKAEAPSEGGFILSKALLPSVDPTHNIWCIAPRNG
jgi:hypothetical protein